MSNRLEDPAYLAGHWPLNSHAQDVSGHGNHGTWTAEAYADNNKGRSAGDFDGATGLVTVGNAASMNFGATDFTWAFRFKVDPTASEFDSLITKRDDTAEGYRIDIRSTYKLSLRLEDGNGDSVVASGDDELNDGVWHYAVIAVDAGTTARMYVDGKVQAFSPDLSLVGDTDNTADLVFGASSEATNVFTGGLSDIRAYNVALTAAEALSLYQQGVPKFGAPKQPLPQAPDTADSNLVLAVLNRSTDGAEDASASSDDGTPTDVIFGSPGGVFNGSTSKIQYSVVTDLVYEKDYTISFWMKSDDDSQTATVFSHTINTNVRSVAYLANTDLRLSHRKDTVFSTKAGTIGAGWVFVVFVHPANSTNNILYIDSIVQVGTGAVEASANAGFFLGAVNVGGTLPFNGEIRDYRVYTNENKGADWVSQEYSRGIPDTDLVIHSLVTGSEDLSGLRNDGVPSGGVVLGRGATFNGTDAEIDYGQPGSIAEVSLWVKTASDTEKLILIDTTFFSIHTSSGTVTSDLLSGLVVYVNGVATMTLATGVWQLLTCQFTPRSPSSFGLGWDGSSYGEFEARDFRVRSSASSADAVLGRYLRTRKYV